MNTTSEPDYTPVDPRDMAAAQGMTIEEVLEYFDRYFGGYAEYVRACDSHTIIEKIEAIQRQERCQNN